MTQPESRMKQLYFILALLAVVGATLAWELSVPRARFTIAEWQAIEKPGDPARGRRIFFIGGCDSCHQKPDQPDPVQLGGGLELKTPFGSFYPPNISSDPVDGIGAWRPLDLANALLSGVSPRGQHYYPAFPYTSYQRMKPVDVADLFAFLRTVPAVRGRPPAHDFTFPFSIRRALGLWKLLYFDDVGLHQNRVRNGTSAATSSKALAIALNATRHATCSVPCSPACSWPVPTLPTEKATRPI
jgi:hypothetical protein